MEFVKAVVEVGEEVADGVSEQFGERNGFVLVGPVALAAEFLSDLADPQAAFCGLVCCFRS